MGRSERPLSMSACRLMIAALFLAVFAAWVGIGFGEGWRTATNVASITSLVLYGLIFVTYLIDGPMPGVLAIPALALATALPVACLVGLHQHGWAWAWYLAWMVVMVQLYGAMVNVLFRERGHFTFALASSLMSGTTSLEWYHRKLHWFAVGSGLAWLLLAVIDAPRLLTSFMGMVGLSLIATSVTMTLVILHRRIRARGGRRRTMFR